MVGGVGYLGLNGVVYHSRHNDEVYVVTRRASIGKRPRIYRIVVDRARKVIVLPRLDEERYVKELVADIGCPRLAYLLVGRLTGTPSQLYESNTYIPEVWGEGLMENCSETTIVFASSVLALGDPQQCAADGIVYEEEFHLAGCRQLSDAGRSKAEGERRLLRLCRDYGGRVALFRLGLLAGRGAYHREWGILYKLARRRILLNSGLNIHLTPASDVFGFARSFIRGSRSSGELPACGWFNIAPWRLQLKKLHMLVADSLSKTKYMLRLPLPEALAAKAFPPEISVQSRYTIRSRYVSVNAYPWREPGEAIREVVEWCISHGGCLP